MRWTDSCLVAMSPAPEDLKGQVGDRSFWRTSVYIIDKI